MPPFRSESSFAKPSSKKFASKSKTLSSRFTRNGILFVLSAPSGAGKTTLVDALRETSEFVYSISCTTRPARASEVDGEDYRFLSEGEFNARARGGEFLEHASVHGHQYGTLLKPIVENLMNGRDVLMDIDTQGAANIRNAKDEFVRQCLADIFLMPPDVDELRRRLTNRGTETAAQIETRLTNAIREMESWPKYRYTIISRTTEEDLQKFRHIMNAERYLSRRLIQK
ncbi:MAG: guanylate kinase [Verrucomicrobia bacterium]|nr:MAG: guanylate kinase [Verrucomicrobiota bacterium]